MYGSQMRMRITKAVVVRKKNKKRGQAKREGML